MEHASSAGPEAERKQITILFADVKGSMELVVDRDPEEVRRLVDPVLERMIDAVHRYGGTVNQVMGDGIMALFGAPIAHEDHAWRACCAALRMQRSVARWSQQVGLPVPVQMRIGLNSGEVVVRAIGSDLHFDYTAVGQATFLAARMEQLAAAGSIQLTADVVRLAGGRIQVKPLGPMPIKGLKDTQEVFELTAISPGTRFTVLAARGLTPIVGRSGELEALSRALSEARRGSGQFVTLIGEAGVGKSRVLWELVHAEDARSWRVLTASAASYAKGTVHSLMIELLMNYFGIEDGDDVDTIQEWVRRRIQTLEPRLEQMVDPILAVLDALPDDNPFRKLEAPERRRRTLESTRALLVAESRRHPLILIFEDLHWIDSGSEAVLDALIDGLPGARILLAATFRPEYQHRWANKSYYTQLRIDPLPSQLAQRLLDSLLGEAPQLQPLKDLLVDRCEGNPLFLEESVRTLLEERALEGDPRAYHPARPIQSVRMPGSVQAVLTARIDRLAAGDKELLQSAAVIGRHIPWALLHAIAGSPEDEVRAGVARLCAGEFLHEVDLFPEPLYAFKHALTHEVTYGSLLRARRRRLHARIVEAIEHRYRDRLSDQVDRLAHHATSGELWGKAFDYLRMAGALAYKRGALEEAIERYEAALATVSRFPPGPEAARRSIDVRLDLHAPLMTVARTHRIAELYTEAERLARELGDPVRLGQVLQRMSQLAWLGGRYRSGAEYARQALAMAETSSDAVTRLHANYFLGLHRHALGDYRGAIPCFEYLVEGPDAALASRIISVTIPMDVPGWCWLAFARVITGNVAQAEAALQRALASAEVSEFPQAPVIARTIEAVVLAHAGRAASCLPTLEQAVERCEQIRFVVFLSAAYSALGLVLMRVGRTASALPYLERALALDDKSGLRTYHAQRQTWWAEGLLRAGKAQDARGRADIAIKTARAMEERGVEAEALLVRGFTALALGADGDAQETFERGLAASVPLGALVLEAHSHLGLAAVRERRGEVEEARRHRETADGIFRETGATPWWPA